MSAVILLSATEAVAVAGPSSEAPLTAALQPVALTDGRFILGAEVLADPLHAEHRAMLVGLPQTDLASLTSVLPVAR